MTFLLGFAGKDILEMTIQCPPGSQPPSSPWALVFPAPRCLWVATHKGHTQTRAQAGSVEIPEAASLGAAVQVEG